jgi:DNA polymerase-3 subunit gamma/tau
MREILDKEAVPFDAAGLRLVAQAADGSMRDGLSLLDQLIAFGGGKASEEEARAMLGTIARDHVVRLAELLGTMNVPELLRCAQSLEEWAPDYAQVLDELASLFVRIAMKQAVSDFEGDELYAPEVLERLAKALGPEDVQLFYQTAITGRRDLGLAPDPRAGFQMTLLRMIAFRPGGEAEQSRDLGTGAGHPGAGGGSANSGAAGARAAAAAAAAAAGGGGRGGGNSARLSGLGVAGVSVGSASGMPVAVPRARVEAGGARAEVGRGQEPESGVGGAPSNSEVPGSWNTIVGQLDLQGAARQLASNCAWVGRKDGVVRLALDARTKFVRTTAQEEKLAQALSRYFGQPVRVEFVAAAAGGETPAQAEQRTSLQDLDAARRAFEADPGVQGLRDRFGATLLPDTIRPVK